MAERIAFQFRVYQRPFRQSLQTQYGSWSVREGLLLRLEMGDRIAFGEIAPLPWFGSESLDEAIAFCTKLGSTITPAAIAHIPDSLPACQFGLEMALEQLLQPKTWLVQPEEPASARLLPYGDDDMRTRFDGEQGCTTWKCKIGVLPLQEELLRLPHLISVLPTADSKLRLDANASLNWETACAWLEACAAYPQIEFLEQPLPTDCLDQMLALSDRFPTPIALDESVATVAQLQQICEWGWHGIVVIKPAIAGSPAQLRQVCHAYQPDVVWSSVFETAIARRYLLQSWIPSVAAPTRALGFGTQHWFADEFGIGVDEWIWQSLPSQSSA
ncbi:o-succinylbenzoate synthase [Leptolyngbya sp. AN02str]|uniref:o-succinylbenzoate synthase n=1 Tax=Leptolyngbya sp. AN02str TaxID=3423363 RepID=UPI003D3213FB